MKPRAMDLNGVPEPPKLVGVMVLLDRSGSMGSIKIPMEAAFKDFVDTQKAISPDGMWLTLHQFDGHAYGATYDRTPLAQLGALGLEPRGSTPLRDSLYRFGTEARKIIDDPADPTERLLLLIITDGGENASTQYSWLQVKELMDGLKSVDCEALWFGTSEALLEAQAALPAFAAAGASVGYSHTPVGANYIGETAKLGTAMFRSGGSAMSASATYTSGVSEEMAFAAPKLDATALNKMVADLRAKDASEAKATSGT